MVSQMLLTDDEKSDPENGERVMNVLQWMANTEKEEKSGDLKTHFIREERISLESLRPESEFVFILKLLHSPSSEVSCHVPQIFSSMKLASLLINSFYILCDSLS